MAQTIKKKSELPTYKFPKTGILSLLPSQWVPYAELIRLAKPVGIMNIYFPYLFGMLYAACFTRPSIQSFLVTNSVIFFSAFILRSAGCAWNDIIDRDLDRKVARCRLRPMARGAISPAKGYLFTTFLSSIWLGILYLVSEQSLPYAPPLILLVIAYPFCKRITDFAQVVLGVTLSWGVLIGCLIMGLEPMVLIKEQLISRGGGLLCLSGAYVIWCVFHDTIYALQDLQDDLKAGIKSMAVRYRYQMKFLLSGLGVAQVGLLALAGYLMGASSMAYYIACPFGNALFCFVVIWKADLTTSEKAAWWFENGCLIIGGAISVGLSGEYLSRL